MIIEFLTNPIVISVILLCALCLCRVNVLLSLIISALVGGIVGNISLSHVMDIFIRGMGANSETALSYILLGAFAAAMTHTGLAEILAKKIQLFIKSNKYLLLFILTGIAILSQNLIPVHIAFIPILIPPLLGIMDKLKLDRRAVACALSFGLKAPYIAIPAGFGLIFQGLIAENIIQNGVEVVKNDIWKFTSILGIGLFIGLLIAIFITYSKPREYEFIEVKTKELTLNDFSLFQSINYLLKVINKEQKYTFKLHKSQQAKGADKKLSIIFHLRQ